MHRQDALEVVACIVEQGAAVGRTPWNHGIVRRTVHEGYVLRQETAMHTSLVELPYTAPKLSQTQTSFLEEMTEGI